MNASVRRIVELVFQDVELTDEVRALREEVMNNCQERYGIPFKMPARSVVLVS